MSEQQKTQKYIELTGMAFYWLKRLDVPAEYALARMRYYNDRAMAYVQF